MMKTKNGTIAVLSLIIGTISVGTIAGCAISPIGSEQTAPTNDQGFRLLRSTTSGFRATWLLARSVGENAVNRPVSHIGSLVSLALKSTGGVLQRVTIGTFQMPALYGDVPEIVVTEPMDLEAFKEKLDKITGTRRDIGHMTFLVDGDENFSRLLESIENAKDRIDIYDWHDLMMEVTGPVVDKLQYESDKAWARASILGDFANFIAFAKGKKENADQAGYPVRVLQTRNFDSDIHKAQIVAIQNAQNFIIIENAYFITINVLLKHGVRVYQYPGMSHVKAAIFDGWASVGSANFDKLSLKVNKELNLATSDPATISALMDQVFVPDLTMSREISEPIDVTFSTHIAEIVVDELL